MRDEYTEGLYSKFTVIDRKGREREDVFVLSPLKDKAAREAIRLYAKLTPNRALAEDLLNWLKEFEEYACKRNRVCPITETLCCCCHCRYRDECVQSDLMCDLVRYQDVLDIKECE